MASQGYPPAEVDITPALIVALLAEQFPDLGERALGESFEGWDNVTTRLGEDRAVRMPRLAASAELLRREVEWLPRLSPRWSFGAPVPLHVGRPGCGYPWTWSVVPWFDGAVASDAPLTGLGAEDLGRALRQIHIAAPADAPTTPWRTTPLVARRDEFTRHLDEVDNWARGEGFRWERERAESVWEEGARLLWAPSHWVHADIHVKNLVTRGGRLAAILDWGEAAAGDPAQDVGQLWLLLDAADAEAALAAYGGVDDATLARARGEAITTAVRLISTGEPGFTASGRRALVTLGVASGEEQGAHPPSP